MPITQVSDTAHWVAMYRALESERTDSLFHDPHARRMAGERGSTIAREVPMGELMAWAVVVRTAVLDELVLDCIRQGAQRVLNLGAGLDTRAFRLRLPSTLSWFDVDLPHMVAHRRACLKGLQPGCRHTHLAADLCDVDALRQVVAAAGQGEGPLLVVTEGLLVYLDPQQAGALASCLHAEPAAQWWLADLVSPSLLAMVGGRWPSEQAGACTPFRFAPADRAGFFGPLGWQESAFHSTFKDGARLHRLPPAVAWWGACMAPWWPGARTALEQLSGVAVMEAMKESEMESVTAEARAWP